MTSARAAWAICVGADFVNTARGFMFALGCIQSMACHTDRCPTGVATQDKSRARALVVDDKATRVAQFHAHTLEALAELIAAAGVAHPSAITRERIMKRLSPAEVKSFADLYPELEPGELLRGGEDSDYAKWWARADAGRWG